MNDDEASQPTGGLSARELEKLIQKELAEGASRSTAAQRPDRPVKPDVQRDLDLILGAILGDLEPRSKSD